MQSSDDDYNDDDRTSLTGTIIVRDYNGKALLAFVHEK